MTFYGLTDRGKVRRVNQDIYGSLELPDITLLVVCDGMGGARAGEVASELACEMFIEFVRQAAQDGVTEDELRDILAKSATLAGETVCDSADNDPEYEGMGTTLVAAAVVESTGTAVIANVGDSRAYLISNGKIRRLTRDHSVVENMLLRGELTPEQARVHPNRNLITRALGTVRGEKADIYTIQLGSEAFLLLCSDGLSNTVRDEEMLNIVENSGDTETACKNLLNLSLQRGAPDNVTVVILDYDSGRTV